MVSFNITHLIGVIIGLAIFGWIGTIDILFGFNQSVWTNLMYLQTLLGLGISIIYPIVMPSSQEKCLQSRVPYRYASGFAHVLIAIGIMQIIISYFLTNPQTASLTQSTALALICSVLALLLWFYESRTLSAKLQRIQVEQDYNS